MVGRTAVVVIADINRLLLSLGRDVE